MSRNFIIFVVAVLMLSVIPVTAIAQNDLDDLFDGKGAIAEESDDEVSDFDPPISDELDEPTESVDDKIAALQQRISDLEMQVADLKETLSPAIAQAKAAREAQEALAKAREDARRRMRADLENYSRDELGNIEKLYQVANTSWNTREAVRSLRTLVDRYQTGNRVGCSLVYLGQMTKGKQSEQYLRQAIEKHSDAFYGDGVQVGPYASYLLATKLIEADREREAEELLDDIRVLYPDAVDHQGNLLVQALPK